jgi:hypothetical protein
MEKLEIYTDPDFTLEIDKSCITAIWQSEYKFSTIFDEEFNKIWKDKFGNIIENGISVDSPIYSDEYGRIETGRTLWSEFWDELQSPNHILLIVYEIYVDTDNSAVSTSFSDVDYYLINTEKVTELLYEDFQANEAWIKQKFQVKTP